jgi:hypothetical protein
MLALQDHYDIKMLTYLMVARVAQLCPGAVLQKLDKLVEPLKLTCTTKVWKVVMNLKCDWFICTTKV